MFDLDPTVLALMERLNGTMTVNAMTRSCEEVDVANPDGQCADKAGYVIEMDCSDCVEHDTKAVCESHLDESIRDYVLRMTCRIGVKHNAQHAYERLTVAFLAIAP